MKEGRSTQTQLTESSADESELVLGQRKSEILEDEGTLGSGSSGGSGRFYGSSISRPGDGLNHEEVKERKVR